MMATRREAVDGSRTNARRGNTRQVAWIGFCNSVRFEIRPCQNWPSVPGSAPPCATCSCQRRATRSCCHEATEGVLRCANDRFTTDVEAGIDQRRTAGLAVEALDERTPRACRVRASSRYLFVRLGSLVVARCARMTDDIRFNKRFETRREPSAVKWLESQAKGTPFSSRTGQTLLGQTSDIGER
jgi:hypothetical protein